MWCEKERKAEKKQTSKKQIRRKRMPEEVSGVMTVELAYLIPVILLVFQLVIYSVFYYHDKSILIGTAGETAVTAAQYERKASTKRTTDWEVFFREQIDGKLILFSEVDVALVQTDDEIEITASAQKGYMRVEVLQRAVVSNPEKAIRRMWVLQQWMTDENGTKEKTNGETERKTEKETE